MRRQTNLFGELQELDTFPADEWYEVSYIDPYNENLLRSGYVEREAFDAAGYYAQVEVQVVRSYENWRSAPKPVEHHEPELLEVAKARTEPSFDDLNPDAPASAWSQR